MIPDRASPRAAEYGYRFLDAGAGRRLEAFEGRLVDRPAPGAVGPRRTPGAWRGPDLRYERPAGWRGESGAFEPWPMALEGLRFELRPTDSGQVGIFPEHLASLPWLLEQVRAFGRHPPTLLNLFAYTGLATLALAAAGASVVHVDAARTTVAWARRNAELSGLGERPIRWIVDDAEAFVAREARRGRRYDGFVIDPPTWGHAAGAGAWDIDGRLTTLLAACAEAATSGAFCLLTAHTSGMAAEPLRGVLATAFARRPPEVETGTLELRAESGARLPLGLFARLTR